MDYPTALPAGGGGLQFGGVASGCGLGDRHRLHPQLTARNAGQIRLALGLASAAGDCIHDIHLAMAGACIAATSVDFLHDDRGLCHGKTRSAVLLGNQSRQPARFS